MSSNFKIRLFVRGGRNARRVPFRLELDRHHEKHSRVCKTASAVFTVCTQVDVQRNNFSGVWKGSSSFTCTVGGGGSFRGGWRPWRPRPVCSLVSGPSSCVTSSSHFTSLSRHCHSPGGTSSGCRQQSERTRSRRLSSAAVLRAQSSPGPCN